MLDFNSHSKSNKVNRKMDLTGKFLLASPIMDDKYFKRTIIYICSHDDEGAVGVIINRISGTFDLRPKLKEAGIVDDALIKDQYPLYLGGPVSINQLLILTIKKDFYHTFDEDPVITIFTDFSSFYHSLKASKISRRFLLVQNMSSWDTEQLYEEIENNAWIVCDPCRNTLLSTRSDLWESEIKKLGLSPNSSHFVNYSGEA